MLVPGTALAQDSEDDGTLTEQVVVTASRAEEKIQDAPAAISVVTDVQLEQAPVRNYGDALAKAPGVNVVQFGVRDVQITPRAATGSLATGQLALVDGRTIYQDFFGFILWDLAPVDFDEVAQIEVVRGPGSAIWGANALNGVVNIITKPPEDLEGLKFSVGLGNQGHQKYDFRWADAPGKVSYKVSASYFEQDDWEHPTSVFGAEVPFTYPNNGTKQPKIDFRLDYDMDDKGRLSFNLGTASTSGLIATGIGPFDIGDESSFSNVKASWEKGDMKLTFFANLLDGEAVNVFATDADGEQILFTFKTDVFDLNFTDGVLFGTLARLVYGGNVRSQAMELNIASGGDDRVEAGVFAELQFLFNDHFWWNVGARYDYFNYSGAVDRIPDARVNNRMTSDLTLVTESVDQTVRRASPRTNFIIRANDNHTFRVGYGQAFRVPSLIENFLSVALTVPTGSTTIPTLPIIAFGQPALTEEVLDSYDLSYNGTFARRVNLSLNYYYTVTEDGINFGTNTEILSPLPPPFDVIPTSLTYENRGTVRNTGVEAALAWRINRWVDVFANYTYQREPRGVGLEEIREFVPSEGELVDPINSPPSHSYTTGINFNRGRFFGSVSGTYRDKTFWTDVLTSDFWGTLPSWFWTNTRIGVRLFDERLTWTAGATNTFDNGTQVHPFGDVIGGLYTTELRLNW